MEKLMFISKVSPVEERSYTDRNGQPAVFTSRGFLLTDGIDTIYAEATGDYAKSIASRTFDPASAHAVQMSFIAREWKDKDGATHYSNDARIIRIA